MSTLPRPIQVLLENYNADVRAAVTDDATAVQLLAMMGAICETTLRVIPQDKRQRVWGAVNMIMGEKFAKGEL